MLNFALIFASSDNWLPMLIVAAVAVVLVGVSAAITVSRKKAKSKKNENSVVSDAVDTGASDATDTTENAPAADTVNVAEKTVAETSADTEKTAENVEAEPVADDAVASEEKADAEPVAETAEEAIPEAVTENTENVAVEETETAETVKESQEDAADALPADTQETGEESSETPAAAEVVAKNAGKYDFILGLDGYHYCLIANNGQLLYESVGYTSYEGAKNAVDTFRHAVEVGHFQIRSDRGGRYSFVVGGKFYGEGYTSYAQCERAIESVKHFAPTKNMVEPVFTPEAEQAYLDARNSLKKASSVNWDDIAAKEASVKKSGKFIVEPEEGGASFALIANNGLCLYTSRIYSDLKSATNAVDAFKKAVYIGNFFATDDKFGNYRFALKGAGTNWYVGDSYAAKDRCLNAIESVKRFVATADIVVNKEQNEENKEEEAAE